MWKKPEGHGHYLWPPHWLFAQCTYGIYIYKEMPWRTSLWTLSLYFYQVRRYVLLATGFLWSYFKWPNKQTFGNKMWRERNGVEKFESLGAPTTTRRCFANAPLMSWTSSAPQSAQSVVQHVYNAFHEACYGLICLSRPSKKSQCFDKIWPLMVMWLKEYVSKSHVDGSLHKMTSLYELFPHLALAFAAESQSFRHHDHTMRELVQAVVHCKMTFSSTN